MQRRWRGFGLKTRVVLALAIVILAIVIFAVMPAALDIFRLNLIGKYLTYGFVAIGLLSYLYAAFHALPAIGALFFGLKAAVLALVVAQLVVVQHSPSPPSTSRKRARARDSRDFTVPMSMPSASAMSA